MSCHRLVIVRAPHAAKARARSLCDDLARALAEFGELGKGFQSEDWTVSALAVRTDVDPEEISRTIRSRVLAGDERVLVIELGSRVHHHGFRELSSFIHSGPC